MHKSTCTDTHTHMHHTHVHAHFHTNTRAHIHTHVCEYSHCCATSLSKQTSNLGSYTALYNDTAIHSLPAIMNALAMAILKKAGLSGNITTYSLPWPGSSKPKFDNGAFSSSLMVGLAFALIAPGFAIGVVQEIQVRSLPHSCHDLPYHYSSYAGGCGCACMCV